jgi:hypothetical protein
MQFQISTGTPTRGRIYAADEMIENKVKSFSQIHGFKLIRAVGSGAEGCLFLAAKSGRYFYLKSPDGVLAQDEISTIEHLKKTDLIPQGIRTYPEDRMIVLPEFPSIPQNGTTRAVNKLIFDYISSIFRSGYVCLDMTPEHVRIEPESKKVFLIDFSGYAELTRFRTDAKELVADRKKMEYRTPEESIRDFRNPEKLQVFLTGLLLFQLLSSDRGLPRALKWIERGSEEYESELKKDLAGLDPENAGILQSMLAFDPNHRKTIQQLQEAFSIGSEDLQNFWRKLKA